MSGVGGAPSDYASARDLGGARAKESYGITRTAAVDILGGTDR